MALGNLNKVTVMGNLGADPEIRRTAEGTPIANMRIATSESWKDKATGERKEKVEWHTVVVFGRPEGGGLAQMIEKWLTKGDKVYVEGQLQTRKWQDKDGQDRWSTEIVVRGFAHTVQIITSKTMDKNRGERGDGPPIDSTPGRAEASAGAPSGGARGNVMDDEIPF